MKRRETSSSNCRSARLGIAVLVAAATAMQAGTSAAQDKKENRPAPSFRDERRWLPKPGDAGERREAAPQPAATTEPQPPQPPAAPQAPQAEAVAKPGAGACPPAVVKATPLEAGRMRLSITSGCRAGQEVVLSYGGAEFVAFLDRVGRADVTVDCFAGAASPVELKFADDTTATAAVEALDLDKVSKLAIIWRAPVNLDLHAFEYAATAGSPGHVSPDAQRSLAIARERGEKTSRGHGFLSSTAGAQGDRDRVEVFTFLHREGQSGGIVSFAVDNETRGAAPRERHCGEGQLAEVAFRIVGYSRRGVVTREAGVVAAAPCGAQLGDGVRLSAPGMPTMRMRW